MTSTSFFVSTAEAAYVAGLAASDINRVVDEKLVPDALVVQEDGTRRVARLAAAFARIYVDLEPLLAARARISVLEELAQRVDALEPSGRDDVQRLHDWAGVVWTVMLAHQVFVDVTPQMSAAASRAQQVDLADSLITVDKEVMGGAPCFTGTRVPIESVLASLDDGELMERMQSSYPFLTPAHIDAARVYLLVHPRRGRPRKMSERSSNIQPRASKVVKPARS